MKLKRGKRVARPALTGTRGILCGIDFSEKAGHAARVGAAVAKRIGEPLILAHAIEMPRLRVSHAKFLKLLTAIRSKELHHEANVLRKLGAKVEERIAAGRPDEVLVDLARREASRLLVVASIGYRGVDRWLIGSVSERAAERATVPILVVRDAQPLLAWARGERPLKVFVCFNHTKTSETALRWVKELTAIGPCEVTVGYVNWPPEEWARLGEPVPPESNPPIIQTVLERDVKAKAGELLGNTSFQIRIESNWGRPDFRLAEMAKESQADLVVVGSHQFQGFERFWHGSVSRGLLHEASMNVAVAPLATARERGTGIAPPVGRVLVATDFSELADAAISRAYSLVRSGGTVHLVHVVTHQSKVPGARFDMKSRSRRSNSPEEKHIKECAAKLRALVPAESADQGIFTQVEVLKGRNVGEAICQSAERLGVDVICLGTHGRSGFSKAVMGSVAQEVTSRSRRSLFLVRAQPR